MMKKLIWILVSISIWLFVGKHPSGQLLLKFMRILIMCRFAFPAPIIGTTDFYKKATETNLVSFGKHGEHAHDIIWENGKIVSREPRNLTDQERKEHADIL